MGRLRRYIRWADSRQDLDPLGQIPSVPPVRLGAAVAAQHGHLLGSRWVESRLETRVRLHDLCARGPGLQPGKHSLRLDGPRHDPGPGGARSTCCFSVDGLRGDGPDARDVLLTANLFIWITLVNTGVIFIIAPLMPTIVHTIGKRNGYLIGGMSGVIGGVGMAFAPGLAIALIGAGIMGVGIAILNTLMWALEADTVEYGEWKTGVRTEGTTYALFSFTRKLGQAFGGAAAAFTLGLGGYISASASHQTKSAQWAIRAACGLVPVFAQNQNAGPH